MSTLLDALQTPEGRDEVNARLAKICGVPAGVSTSAWSAAEGSK